MKTSKALELRMLPLMTVVFLVTFISPAYFSNAQVENTELEEVFAMDEQVWSVPRSKLIVSANDWSPENDELPRKIQENRVKAEAWLRAQLRIKHQLRLLRVTLKPTHISANGQRRGWFCVFEFTAHESNIVNTPGSHVAVVLFDGTVASRRSVEPNSR